MSDYAAALAARNLDLPAPDGVGEHGTRAWRLSTGEWLWAGPGVVHDSDGRSVDAIEQDAYAALAACAWARSVGGGA